VSLNLSLYSSELPKKCTGRSSELFEKKKIEAQELILELELGKTILDSPSLISKLDLWR
jgi:hypothetical protein